MKYEFISKEPVKYGWSGDAKFIVVTAEGERCLLRISPEEKYESRKRTFDMMQRAARLGIPMCQPLDFGECEEGVYILQSWIDGEDAETALAVMDTERRYQYGIDAGRILRKLHTLPAFDGIEPWDIRFGRKIDRKLKMYDECPIKYPGGESLISFINANRHLIAGRGQCWQHGDYHVGNMVIGTDGRLYIIDFDRDDCGDPWEEFNRIVWSAEDMPDFSSGMVNGYFDNEVPMDFWRLLALYISSNTLSSLPWAIPFGQNEVDTMLRQCRQVLAWYDGMNTVVPNWYSDKNSGE